MWGSLLKCNQEGEETQATVERRLVSASIRRAFKIYPLKIFMWRVSSSSIFQNPFKVQTAKTFGR